MSHRLSLMSVFLACATTAAIASEPNASVVVSDLPAPEMPGVTVQGDIQPSDVMKPEAVGVYTEDCVGCDACSCGHCGGYGTFCGRLFGYGCEDGCCLNTCNMAQHYMYYPTEHGYYYFIPYNYTTIRRHQQAVMRWGGDPRNPYDNTIFEGIYDGLEPDEDDEQEDDQTPEVETTPPAAPATPPAPTPPQELDPPAEPVQPATPAQPVTPAESDSPAEPDSPPAPATPPAPIDDAPEEETPEAEIDPFAKDSASGPSQEMAEEGLYHVRSVLVSAPPSATVTMAADFVLDGDYSQNQMDEESQR
jgi:hypothetical protein